MNHELGVTYMHPGDKTLFVVVQETEHLVWGMVLQDNPEFRKPMPAGAMIPIFVGSSYWDESVSFASLEESGKVSP